MTASGLRRSCSDVGPLGAASVSAPDLPIASGSRAVTFHLPKKVSPKQSLSHLTGVLNRTALHQSNLYPSVVMTRLSVISGHRWRLPCSHSRMGSLHAERCSAGTLFRKRNAKHVLSLESDIDRYIPCQHRESPWNECPRWARSLPARRAAPSDAEREGRMQKPVLGTQLAQSLRTEN
jgi:hypothetical protein